MNLSEHAKSPETVAHDLKNLLSAIAGAADLLEKKVGRDQAEISRYTKIISKSCEQALRLCRGGDGEADDTGFLADPDECIKQMSALLICGLGSKIIPEVRLNAAGAALNISYLQLQNVLTNLVFNARDAMPAGGRLQICTNRVYLTEAELGRCKLKVSAGEYFELSVRDEGEGIPAELMPRIFEPKFTTKPKGKGSGWGLVSVLQTVSDCGGTLRIECAGGQGCCFYIYFPLAENLFRQRLLLVDDDVILREITGEILSRAGAEVVAVGTAAEAQQACRGGKFAAAVLDLMLPDGNGEELYACLKKIDPDLKAVFMSGREQGCLPLPGEVAFVGKPCHAEEIVQKLLRLLAKKQDS